MGADRRRTLATLALWTAGSQDDFLWSRLSTAMLTIIDAGAYDDWARR